MKISQKLIFLFFLGLFHAAYGSGGTSLQVEVDGTDEASITKGFAVNKLIKIGDGKLNMEGIGYNMDYLKVLAGTVWVDDATDLYITDSKGNFIDQPVLLGPDLYTLKIMDMYVDVPTGYAEVSSPITVALLYKIGQGTANFTGGLVVHFLNIAAGTAIINSNDVPTKQVQLGSILQASSALDIPNVSMIADGLISYVTNLAINASQSKYPVIIRDLVLQDFTLFTDNENTEIDNLDASTSGGTLSNADFVTLKGANGCFLFTKKGTGTVNVVGDLSGSSIPVTTQNGILQVSGAGKLPSALVDISIGAQEGVATTSTFQLSAGLTPGAPNPGAVSGPMVVEPGCMLEVDPNLLVPAENDNNDVFMTGLTFLSNSTLKLGDGVVWRRPIKVGHEVPHT